MQLPIMFGRTNQISEGEVQLLQVRLALVVLRKNQYQIYNLSNTLHFIVN